MACPRLARDVPPLRERNCPTERGGRQDWLFAVASVSRSIVSSAIFCASSMSPRTSPPEGMKHHFLTVRPAGSSCSMFITGLRVNLYRVPVSQPITSNSPQANHCLSWSGVSQERRSANALRSALLRGSGSQSSELVQEGNDHDHAHHGGRKKEAPVDHPPTILGMNNVSRAVGSKCRTNSDMPLAVRLAAMKAYRPVVTTCGDDRERGAARLSLSVVAACRCTVVAAPRRSCWRTASGSRCLASW
jgi:hypothetical protein